MIYFVQAGDAGAVKIGYAHSPEAVHERLIRLQTGSPETLHLVAMADGTTADERALHRRLAEHRIRGEWFRGAAPEVQEAIIETLEAEYRLWADETRWVE